MIIPFTARAQSQGWTITVLFLKPRFSVLDLNISICKDTHLEVLIFLWSMIYVMKLLVWNCSVVNRVSLPHINQINWRVTQVNILGDWKFGWGDTKGMNCSDFLFCGNPQKLWEWRSCLLFVCTAYCNQTFYTRPLLQYTTAVVVECSSSSVLLAQGKFLGPTLSFWITGCKEWTNILSVAYRTVMVTSKGLAIIQVPCGTCFLHRADTLSGSICTSYKVESIATVCGRLLGIMSKKIICHTGRWVFCLWISHPESCAV